MARGSSDGIKRSASGFWKIISRAAYPASERQGFYWWEIDLTHYALVVLSWCGLVWDLRSPPEAIYAEAAKPR